MLLEVAFGVAADGSQRPDGGVAEVDAEAEVGFFLDVEAAADVDLARGPADEAAGEQDADQDGQALRGGHGWPSRRIGVAECSG
jgi:hypothetical protein